MFVFLRERSSSLVQILVDEKKEGGKNRAENVEENLDKYFGTLVRWKG